MLKIAVSPRSTTVIACSLGVLGLFDDSTSLIIWLMYVDSGFVVTFAISLSLVIFEPPISWSDGAFLMGVDSPVRRDSSTIAIPSRTSESIGTMSPFSRRIISPALSWLDDVWTVLLSHPSLTTFLHGTSSSSLRRLFAVFLACLSAMESES